MLSASDLVALYARHWRIEEAFLQTKRLLGVSFLWSGAFNAIAVKAWATWLLDAVLIEMVYPGLYHFSGTFQCGEATNPVAFLAAQDDLGIVKRRRKYRERTVLDSLHLELNW